MNALLQDHTTDRIGLTLIFAVLVHAALILGITFSAELTPALDNSLPTLDVILVQKSATKAPEQVDFLAQADQLGGGTKAEKLRPTAPWTGPALKPDTGIAPTPSPAAAPEAQPQTPTPVLTREQAPRRTPSGERVEEQPPRPLPSAAELLLQAREIARLEAELDQDLQAYAHRTRHKYISASTREYLYASYMQAWVDKVERIGNLNYPADARRKNVHGSLVLDVAIGWSGEVRSIQVLQSSGHDILDQAAIRIVEMAAPYTPLPDQIRTETDTLHITRTWQFLPGEQFGSGD